MSKIGAYYGRDDGADISDINSWKDAEFYNDHGGFMTISDVIASYEEHEQEHFNVLALHKKGATPLEIEKAILENAILTVGFKDEDEDGLAHELVKLSSCTHWMEKYKKEDMDNIIAFCERQKGQWYFQPDQRCALVQKFIDDDPRIASDLMSYEDWMISQGLDPVQKKFNRILIDCFNSERIDGFKEEYQNLITRTFGDIFPSGEKNDA